MASEIPESRPSEAHRALSSARALSTATKRRKKKGVQMGAGGLRSTVNGNAPCLEFGRCFCFFLVVFVVVGGYRQCRLCELKKDALSARGYVRVCLVGTATPFDEPCGPICKADIVGRLFCCCCCCCCRRCIRIIVSRAGFRLVGGRIVVVVIRE
jgi:hypothetical protein